MAVALQHTLLELFGQVAQNPDLLPSLPLEDWPEASEERQLLAGFSTMLTCLQQSKRQAVDEKEAQYRSIFEASSDGILITTFEGVIVEANPAVCTMFGYAYEELLGLHYSQFTSPELHLFVAKYLRRIQRGDSLQTQSIGVRKDGTRFHAEVHGQPFLFKGQMHILSAVHDVTEPKRAEEQLREKEAQYRSVFEATVDGLFIIDLDGTMVEANPAMCKMLGYSHDEFLSLPMPAIIHPDSLPLIAVNMQKALIEGSMHAEVIGVHRNSTLIHSEVYGVPLLYEGKPHLLGVVRDINERLQAEQELREKEEQYRSIFETVSEGLCINDLQTGYIVEANPAHSRMFGYSHDELIHLHPTVIIPPESMPTMKEGFRRIKAGESFHTPHVVGRCKDGTLLPVEANGAPFMYKGKLHSLWVVRDITERLRAEEQLREKEEQYRNVFETVSEGVSINDMESGYIVEANPAMSKIFGYGYEELLRLPPTELVHPDSLHIMTEGFQRVQAGEHVRSYATVRRKDGTWFPVEADGAPFIYKGKLHSLSVVRDITERMQAMQLLEQRVAERTRELSALLEVSHNIASMLEERSLLQLILDQVKTVVDYVGASVSLAEGNVLRMVAYQGFVADEQLLELRYPIEPKLNWRPTIVDDVWEDSPRSQAFRAYMGEIVMSTLEGVHSWMSVPVQFKDRLIGMLTMGIGIPSYYTPHHGSLVQAIASQAAVGIENARLYEQAQELAAFGERQRLARELHDSVSQALYGISLGTHTAQSLLKRDPSKVAEPLNYVLSLAEAALAEMRALIFELRPESLETEGLVTSLTKQATALQARHHIEVSLDLCDEPDVSLKIKQELHRVAQEALHNVVKHASATRVDLRLARNTKAVVLEVRDNGKGFDARGSFPGHLGLHSMRERMERFGGTLRVESQPGVGTTILASLPVLTAA